MPDNPSYIHRLTEILAEARKPKPIPFFRRRDIEALFGLKRRQAINLMHEIGAVRVSYEIAVPQEDLVSWLKAKVSDPARTREIQRQERVIGRIVEVKAENAARAVKIAIPDGVPLTGLPDGVSISPGMLAVSFDNDVQLLERLFMLVKVFAANPEMLSNLQPAPDGVTALSR